jgi:hypothetical protein
MATNPDCWVQFWERQDYEGGTITFTGPFDCPNMGAYELNNPDGIDKGLDDQVDSLKTGSQTWLELYRGKDYQDNYLKVPPDSSYSDLDDFSLGDASNSFILYDTRPVSWPISQNENDTPGTCWVKLYNGSRFSTIPTRLNGPGESSIYQTPYGAVRSLSTGPDTWIELYSEAGFQGSQVRLGPSSLVVDMERAYRMTVIGSLNIFSVEPDAWSPTPPTDAGASFFLAVQTMNVNSIVEELVAGIVGLVPEVGAALAGVLEAFWPDPLDPMKVWDAIDDYMRTLLQGLINQVKVDDLRKRLDGLYNLLKVYNETPYGTSQKGQFFTSLLSELLTDEPYFIDSEEPETLLTYQVSLGTIMLVVLREQALFYQEIYNEPDPNPEEHQKTLLDKIDEYTKLAAKAADGAIRWRLGQITVQDAGGSSFVVVDAYTNYRSSTYTLYADADEAKTRLQEQVGHDYWVQLEPVVHPARLWKYLDPTVNGRPQLEVYPVESLLYGSPTGTPFSDEPDGKKITGVFLCTGSLVDGLQLYYGGEPGPMHGRQSGANQKLYTFENDELIVAAYGGAGQAVDQIFFRTSLGRDFGNGGSGGSFWTAVAPQGVGAALVKISGYQTESGLQAIRFHWEYSRYV